MTKRFAFDPRAFVRAPFKKCPDCGELKFGITSIGPLTVQRRCSACMRPGKTAEALPKLAKKIIYLDQNILSEMMKAINPESKANKKGTVEKVWKTVFEKLDRLSKLQLVVCPDSNIHSNESLLSPFYTALKRMYELLSHGATFYDHSEIADYQMRTHVRHWAKQEPYSFDFDPQRVVHGELNRWQDRLLISVNSNFNDEWIEELRQHREKGAGEFQSLFEQWQQNPDRDFNDWLEIEFRDFGPTILRSFYSSLADYLKVQEGISPFSMVVVNRALNAMAKINLIESALVESGVPQPEARDKAVQYLGSADLREIPHLRIAAMLYAAIARKAGADKKMKSPGRGTFSDISAISSFMPYCDAMFIDNFCRGLLIEEPLASKLTYGTQIFSKSNIEMFLHYLNEIETTAPVEHVALVKSIYGDDWDKPFVELYQNSDDGGDTER